MITLTKMFKTMSKLGSLAKLLERIDGGQRSAARVSNTALTVNYVVAAFTMTTIVLNYATWMTILSTVAATVFITVWFNFAALNAAKRSTSAFQLYAIVTQDDELDQMATALAVTYKLRCVANLVTFIVSSAVLLLGVFHLTYTSQSLMILTAALTSLVLVLANVLSTKLNGYLNEALEKLRQQLNS